MSLNSSSSARSTKVRRRCTTKKHWTLEERDKLWNLRERFPRAGWKEIKAFGSFDRTPAALYEQYRIQRGQRNPATDKQPSTEPSPASNVVVLRLPTGSAARQGDMDGNAAADHVENNGDDAMSISSGEDISYLVPTEPPATTFLRVHESPGRAHSRPQTQGDHVPATTSYPPPPPPPPSSQTCTQVQTGSTSNIPSTAYTPTRRTDSTPTAREKPVQSGIPGTTLPDSISIPDLPQGIISEQTKTALIQLFTVSCEVHANMNHDHRKEIERLEAEKKNLLQEKDDEKKNLLQELSDKDDELAALKAKLKVAEGIIGSQMLVNKKYICRMRVGRKSVHVKPSNLQDTQERCLTSMGSSGSHPPCVSVCFANFRSRG